uniref:Reverse transcriptase/retrotransposon-derived protein RNase H-like domain-containing protein n=1 Tax=Cajanus cajan TaxID=3821 RepID=A0A151SYC9_CAJCA|nr:hypothetical protein KK1_015258 [Cajanus cajan]
MEWPPPQTVQRSQGFLGLLGFYRKFIPNYASIAQPLAELVKKENFKWSTATQCSFGPNRSSNACFSKFC